MEKFRTTQNSFFRSYYEKYYCDALDKLKVCIIPEEWSHYDAFSITGNCIFCDILLVKKFKLSDMECLSCIAHEVGHFLSPPKKDMSDQQEREMHADQYVVELGLSDHLISALNKMCPKDELTKLRIEKMSNTK